MIAKNEFTNFHAMSQEQVDKKDFNFVRIQEVNERIDEIRKEKQREKTGKDDDSKDSKDSGKRRLDESLDWQTMPQEILENTPYDKWEFVQRDPGPDE